MTRTISEQNAGVNALIINILVQHISTIVCTNHIISPSRVPTTIPYARSIYDIALEDTGFGCKRGEIMRAPLKTMASQILF
jgi:hypothetical protein